MNGRYICFLFAAIALIFAFAGCATNPTSASRASANPGATDQSEHPELAGLTKEQIAHLLWRTE
jgi:hypothetical protein